MPPRIHIADALVADPETSFSPGYLVHEEDRVLEVGAGEGPQEGERIRYPGGAVLIPGLVNAHCHLAFGEMRHLAHDRPFLDWMQGAILPAVERAEADPEIWRRGARRSAREALAGGCTFLADNFLRTDGCQAMREAGLGGVFFQEVFGSLAPDEDEYIAESERAWTALSAALDGLPYGYSPHTLWTCPPRVFRAVAARARAEGRRIAFHLSESVEEEEFFRHSRGPLFEAYRKRGVLDRWEFGQSPTRWLESAGLLASDMIAAHGAQLDGEDLEVLARHDVGLVHCPTSNAKLCVGVAPIAEARELGIRVALGTDSVASSGRLDLFAEMRAYLLGQRARARHARGLGARQAFAAATVTAANLLGAGSERGRLAAGSPADFVLLDLSSEFHGPLPAEPLDLVVWSAGPSEVREVWRGGQRVLDVTDQSP